MLTYTLLSSVAAAIETHLLRPGNETDSHEFVSAMKDAHRAIMALRRFF